jgi:hypothetical protein
LYSCGGVPRIEVCFGSDILMIILVCRKREVESGWQCSLDSLADIVTNLWSD